MARDGDDLVLRLAFALANKGKLRLADLVYDKREGRSADHIERGDYDNDRAANS